MMTIDTEDLTSNVNMEPSATTTKSDKCSPIFLPQTPGDVPGPSTSSAASVDRYNGLCNGQAHNNQDQIDDRCTTVRQPLPDEEDDFRVASSSDNGELAAKEKRNSNDQATSNGERDLETVIAAISIAEVQSGDETARSSGLQTDTHCTTLCPLSVISDSRLATLTASSESQSAGLVVVPCVEQEQPGSTGPRAEVRPETEADVRPGGERSEGEAVEAGLSRLDADEPTRAVTSGPITYAVYESERQMPDIMRLITKDLSEPYSIYTYRYFIHNWPHLCFLALDGDRCVGAIVSKLDVHKKLVKRGYIAMLAVAHDYRKRGIGSQLVVRAIRSMVANGCDEVVLETEISNMAALNLYQNLGFVRDKRLFRYYLNGVDALRLKLWIR